MKRLLHIIATPRAEESRTLEVSKVFVEVFRKSHSGWDIDELNLFEENLPELTVRRVDGKYALLSGKDLPKEFQEPWKDIIAHIERFLSADGYLVSAPMWNFGIPYPLKHYIDVILQPKYLFRYTEKGPEGLVREKKMVVITSRGGDYSSGSPARSYDLQEPYLKTVFGFAGLTDIDFINAQPMDAAGPKVREEKIAEAQDLAREIAERF